MHYEKTLEWATYDALTSLYNRRYFMEHCKMELERARRHNFRLSMIMADLDYFKNYNDTNGHLKGDIALKKVAKILASNVRQTDLLARFGGEEFIILLYQSDTEEAKRVAEKIRKSIAANAIDNAVAQPNGKFSITLGISTYPDDSTDMMELIDAADKALYLGKTRGKDCVCSYREME